MSLQTKITDLSAAIAAKLNDLHSKAELNANKKQDLTSVNAADYPSVPAVNAGLSTTLASANTYTDTQMVDVVKDANYVHTDNNYTTSEKNKLAGLESSKYKGLYTTMVALETAITTPVAGDYADIDSTTAGEDMIRYIYDANDDKWIAQQGESSVMTNSQVKTAYESNADTNAFTDANVTQLGSSFAHISSTTNPHNVTKAQVGLSNVDNTADMNKPVSTATSTAIGVVQTDLNSYKTTNNTAVAAVQTNLDEYKLVVGESFPDYVFQFNNAITY